MTDVTPEVETSTETAADTAVDAVEENPTEYTSETAPVRGKGLAEIAAAAGLGRRKQAIARVRLVPGTGKWTINGRDLDNYFPNKVHQQLVNSPFAVLDIEDKFD